jgi:hypothetical protein
MSGTLSLIGRYRKQLISLVPVVSKYSLESSKKIERVLDDEYIASIPLDRYLLITFKLSYMGDILQYIIKVRGIQSHLGSTKPSSAFPSLVMCLIYGTEVSMGIPVTHDIYSWSIDSTKIIEYTPLDTLDAPLFINWFWLSSSMKEKLFNI